MILYQLISSRLPYEAKSDPAILGQVASVDPVPVALLFSHAPRDLVSICRKCLEKDASSRYQTAGALADDLRRFLAGQPTLAHPLPWPARVWRWGRRRPAAAILAVVCLLSVVGAAGGIFFHQLRLESALELARRQQRKAENLQGVVQRQFRDLRRRVYAQDMHLASESWQNSQVGQTLELLARNVPGRGEEDQRSFSWHYLNRLCHSDRLTLRGHLGEVYHASFSPSGSTLCSAGQDGYVLFWSARDGQLLSRLRAHATETNCATFSPDGTLLATTSDDSTARVCDVQTQQLRHELRGHSGEVVHAAFSPDGRTLATCATDGSVRLWDPATGSILRVLEGADQPAEYVAFARQRPLLVASSRDRTLRIWRLDDAAEPTVLRVAGLTPTCVEFCPSDDRLLAYAQSDLSVCLRNWQTDEAPQRFEGHAAGIRALGFSPDGAGLASCDGLQTINIWSAHTGALLNKLRGHTSRVWGVSWSPDGKLLASPSADGMVKVWDPFAAQGAPSVVGKTTSDVVATLFDAAGARIAYFTKDGLVRAWDVATERPIAEADTHVPLTCGAWIAGDRAIAVGTDQGHILVLDARRLNRIADLPAHAGRVACLAVASQGMLASAGEDRQIRLWNMRSLNSAGTMEQRERDVKGLAFSPDGRALVSVDRDRGVYMWNVASRKLWRALQGHSGGVACCAFDPDGHSFVSAGLDGTVSVWDLPALRVSRNLSAHPGPIRRATVTGSTLTTCGDDGALRFWDTQSLVNLLELKSGAARYRCHDVSTNGRQVTAAGEEADGHWVVHAWRPVEQ